MQYGGGQRFMKPFHEIPFFLVNASLSRLVHCSENGPYFRDWVPMGISFGPYWVPIYISRFHIFSVWGTSTQRKRIQFVNTEIWENPYYRLQICLWQFFAPIPKSEGLVMCYTCPEFTSWTLFTFKFQRLTIWVPIVGAEGPYWGPISWKVGSLLGPYS